MVSFAELGVSSTCFTITELDYDTYTRSTFLLCFHLCYFVPCAGSFLFHIRNKSLTSLSSLSLPWLSSSLSPSCFCPFPLSSFLAWVYYISYTPHEHYFSEYNLLSSLISLFLAFPHVTEGRWGAPWLLFYLSLSSLWLAFLSSVGYIWYCVCLMEYSWGSFPGFWIFSSFVCLVANGGWHWGRAFVLHMRFGRLDCGCRSARGGWWG